MTIADHAKSAEYLSNHPLLRTGDLDEARHSVGKKFCDHRLDIAQRRLKLAVRHNHVAGRHSSINYLHYGAEVTIDPGMLGSFYLLQIPLSGRASVQHRGAEIFADARTATLLNPDRETTMRWSGECRKLLLQLDRSYLEAVAQQLIGAELPGPIRFASNVDLVSEGGRRVRQMVCACVQAAEAGELFQGNISGSDIRVEQDLALELLTRLPSNISHIIERADHGSLPRGIRAAIDYIHAHLRDSVQLSDIAAHADMNIRTLQKGFQRSCGQSPMQVLRNARLDAAHYQLMAQQDKSDVTTAAFSNGFSHLGRFARDYKIRFGHSPSQTAQGKIGK
ncbi:AraC family transcriptional regulator [Phaeobacter porticola]|uniref:Transcriptional regulator, AraC family n=1 Tax=Phaeobacter porticola TaxID=1844006 RepID=A0A1L3IA84_9RHOB|nr:AraC family transcriptional regulator [Phaeobacter porticola]APG49080.1 transcriptional regulator, AraC family [Phaeobacter porticola]